MAGPRSRRHEPCRPPTSPRSSADLATRADCAAAGFDRVGGGLVLPQQRQAWRRQRWPHPAGAAAGWEVNEPDELARSSSLEGIQQRFGKPVSFADLVVLAGNAASRRPPRTPDSTIEVPFTPGRGDATQEQTDVESFASLEPKADGFRNYAGKGEPARRVPPHRPGQPARPVRAGDDGPGRRPARAGRQLRRLRQRCAHRPAGRTDDRLLRQPARHEPQMEPTSATTGPTRRGRAAAVTWPGSRVDLVFGSNSQLRALAEVYAEDDAKEKFVKDFVAAWTKVMTPTGSTWSERVHDRAARVGVQAGSGRSASLGRGTARRGRPGRSARRPRRGSGPGRSRVCAMTARARHRVRSSSLRVHSPLRRNALAQWWKTCSSRPPRPAPAVLAHHHGVQAAGRRAPAAPGR